MAKDKNKLAQKILSKTTAKYANFMNSSILVEEQNPIVTTVPAINIALMGDIEGGLLPGFHQIAGPSKHFKTSFGLVLVEAFLRTHDEGVVVFFDSEFGASMRYFDNYGITEEFRERIIHIPFENLETLKFEITKVLDGVDRGEHVMIFIDSIGLSASKKEVEDALNEKSSADMTRAKQLSSIARIITPQLSIKKIPCVAINHVYKTQDLFAKDVVSGGTKLELSSETIWIISRVKEKTNDNVTTGYTFNIKIQKSRITKEETKIPITVSWEGGIHKWSGMCEIAEEFGILQPCKGPRNSKAYKYVSKDLTERIVREIDIDKDDALWMLILAETDIRNMIKNKYVSNHKPIDALLSE